MREFIFARTSLARDFDHDQVFGDVAVNEAVRLI